MRTRHRGARCPITVLLAVLALGCGIGAGRAQAYVAAEWDFTTGRHGWTANARVANLSVTPAGLDFDMTGVDPWIEGPAVNYPSDRPVRVTLRMRSNADPYGELFYGPFFQAGHSVRFTVNPDGQWHEYVLALPALGANARLRLDPANDAGHATVAWIRAEVMPVVDPPPLPPPTTPGGDAPPPIASVQSGELTLRHYGTAWGAYRLRVGGSEMAAGHDHELLAVVEDEQVIWLDLGAAAVELEPTPGGGLLERCQIGSSSGNAWTLTRRFEPGPAPGTIAVTAGIRGRTASEILHVPWLTLFPGLSSFGARKHQGILAGIEYLADEPSSSTLDVRGPEHDRRVPDSLKLTLPLMAIEAVGAYVGVSWTPSPQLAPIFDSPDRTFGAAAHLMALWAPEVGPMRRERELFGWGPTSLAAAETLTVHATLLGGSGQSVVPAVQQVCQLQGYPAVPDTGLAPAAAIELLAHGWLDSAAHQDGLWRHAVWGSSFPPARAADAPFFMEWLALQTPDAALAGRLRQGAQRGLEQLEGHDPLFASGVSHVRPPIAPMLFGNLPAYLQSRVSQAGQSMTTSFDARGIHVYRPPAGGTDFSQGHFANHANGLSAGILLGILEAATLSGDRSLASGAIALLDRQTALYRHSEPRGAQTWEIPLHTPDILAAAHLVRCYVLAYQMNGRTDHLDEARYWAWTGIPFVYLRRPAEGAVGPYATIPVLGATNWEAPVWIGLPVQWCGLVYASALHMLAEHDASAPWREIARGITAAGLQMTFPLPDIERQGLLPDVFYLREQLRAGPAINPGTVQAHVPELFGDPSLYTFRRLPQQGWFLHLPGAVEEVSETTGGARFLADAWPQQRYSILLSRVADAPQAVAARPASERPAGADAGQAPAAWRSVPFEYRPETGWLILDMDIGGRVEVQIAMTQLAASWDVR